MSFWETSMISGQRGNVRSELRYSTSFRMWLAVNAVRRACPVQTRTSRRLTLPKMLGGDLVWAIECGRWRPDSICIRLLFAAPETFTTERVGRVNVRTADVLVRIQ